MANNSPRVQQGCWSLWRRMLPRPCSVSMKSAVRCENYTFQDATVGLFADFLDGTRDLEESGPYRLYAKAFPTYFQSMLFLTGF